MVPHTNMSINSCFAVDLSKLENLEHVLCDDLGTWSQDITSKKYCKVHKPDSTCNRVAKTEKNAPCNI